MYLSRQIKVLTSSFLFAISSHQAFSTSSCSLERTGRSGTLLDSERWLLKFFWSTASRMIAHSSSSFSNFLMTTFWNSKKRSWLYIIITRNFHWKVPLNSENNCWTRTSFNWTSWNGPSSFASVWLDTDPVGSPRVWDEVVLLASLPSSLIPEKHVDGWARNVTSDRQVSVRGCASLDGGNAGI
jgi:hypothetical protein